MKSEIAVIIVNWNGREYLEKCLDSLKGQSLQDFKVILVDNGSTDDSVSFVEKNYSEVEVIKLEENYGFSFANNVGIKKAFENPETKYIITLNNDTELDEKYLENIVDCAESNENCASVQPKVLNFFDKEKIDNVGIVPSYFGLAFNLGEGEKDGEKFSQGKEIFGANATAALYSKEALEKTKLSEGEYFDNSYFAYFEDVDLAWRMKLAGFQSFYCPKAKVFHVHSATGKNISEKRFLTYRNSWATVFKNYPMPFLISALILIPIQILVIILKKRKPKDLVYLTKSFAYIVKNWKDISKKRSLIQRSKKIGNKELEKWLKFWK